MSEKKQDSQSVDTPEVKEATATGKKKEGTSGLAVAGLVVGILAILGSLIPLFNLVSAWFAVIAVGLSIAGIIIVTKGTKGGKGIAIAGLVLGVVTIIIVVVMYATAGAASDDAADSAKDSTSSSETTQAKEEEAKESADITIGDAETGKDYEGKKTVIVDFKWTNSDDESASLLWTYDIKAFQDGVELEQSLFSDDWLNEDEKSDWTDSSKEIKPGATINTSIAFEVDDGSKPVDIEITKIWSDDIVAQKTIKLK